LQPARRRPAARPLDGRARRAVVGDAPPGGRTAGCGCAAVAGRTRAPGRSTGETKGVAVPTKPGKSSSPKRDLPVKRFRSQAAWQKWLDTNHERSQGLWIEFAKKASGRVSVNYKEALEVALCYGWIDGQTASVDETWYRQRFTPRRPRSRWSEINRGSVERLHREGRLAPAGIREMEAAQRDGRWAAAYGSSRTMTVPPDLEAALAENSSAGEAFEKLDRKNRFAILYRLQDAKRAQTRARRLADFVGLLARGETPLGVRPTVNPP
jgi:uncharacterized protein YdeI (YjbR/CyaY-like superfamily)